jgi:hypothetical protein
MLQGWEGVESGDTGQGSAGQARRAGWAREVEGEEREAVGILTFRRVGLVMPELGTVGMEVRVSVWIKDGIIGHSILGSGEQAG